MELLNESKTEIKTFACRKFLINDLEIEKQIEVMQMNPLEFKMEPNIIAIKFIKYYLTNNNGRTYSKRIINETPWVWFGKRVVSNINKFKKQPQNYCITRSNEVISMQRQDITISEYIELLEENKLMEDFRKNYIESLNFIHEDKRLEWKEFFYNCYSSLDIPLMVKIMSGICSAKEYSSIFKEIQEYCPIEKQEMFIKSLVYFCKFGFDFGNYCELSNLNSKKKTKKKIFENRKEKIL